MSKKMVIVGLLVCIVAMFLVACNPPTCESGEGCDNGDVVSQLYKSLHPQGINPETLSDWILVFVAVCLAGIFGLLVAAYRNAHKPTVKQMPVIASNSIKASNVQPGYFRKSKNW